MNIKSSPKSNRPLTISRVVESIPEAMSIKYNTLVYELQRKKKDVIVLSLGESFFDIPLFSFHNLPYEKGYHYSHSRGILELREKISTYYKRHYGVVSDPTKELLISAGSKIVIYMALRAIVCPRDEVIIFEPAWVSYSEQVRLAYGIHLMVPYYEGVNDIIKYITPRTKAIVINNPNNPSGKVYSRKELSDLFSIAERYNLYVISDEAYSDFVQEEPFISMGCLDPRKKRTIIVNSISKNCGMSGWRVGYAITNEHLINMMLKINQHLVTCPATLLELYLARYFDRILRITTPQIKKVVQERQRIAKYMDKLGLKRLPGTGTFYFCVSIEPSRLRSEEFATQLLTKYQVATVPGIGYGKSLDKFLRVGVGTEPVFRIKRGLQAIRKLINETAS